MSDFVSKPCTAFDGHRMLATGPLGEVALAVKRAVNAGLKGRCWCSRRDRSRRRSRSARHQGRDPRAAFTARRRGSCPFTISRRWPRRRRARTRSTQAGVVAREVTLLPRHWEWLATQPGGASVVLRRLVEDARRANAGPGEARARRDAAYKFMSAVAGDFAGFEEATRALFAGRHEAFEEHMASWPNDVRGYVLKLALGADIASEGAS